MNSVKLFVVKHNFLGFLTETLDFVKSLSYAMIFDDYELALCYCPSDCFIIALDVSVFKVFNCHGLSIPLNDELVIKG